MGQHDATVTRALESAPYERCFRRRRNVAWKLLEKVRAYT
jgi:hypothetical protein